MIDFPNAKINLGLHIINKRDDGYHNIETCFYPIGWKDVLEIIPAEKTEFTSSGLLIPGRSEDNLCVKAYELVNKKYPIPPVKIHLHKIVPMGAGLGGGSSDAAFTIISLNKLFEIGMTVDEMSNMAALLGSDCAFFTKNEPVFALEKGDKWQALEIENLKGYYLVVVYPGIHVSTPEAYKNVIKRGGSAGLKEKLSHSVKEWKNLIENDFEKSVFPQHPVLESIKNDLYTDGAIYASMSGSGSAVFGIYTFETDISRFKKENYLVWGGDM